MSMRLWINGTELTDFILSTPYKDTIDEELDQLNFQIKSDTRLSYKKFDKVMYWIGHGSTVALNKKMAIFDVVESWKGEKWVYQITCLSPTKILENIIINGMAETYYTQENHIGTLYNQLVRVKDKINAQLSFEMSTYPQIIFDNAVITSANFTEAPSDFLWDGQVNVREIFNDMLDKADALIIATDFTIDTYNNITSITLGYVKREKSGVEIVNSANDVDNGGLNSVKQVVKGITYNRNSEFACGNIISLTKNAVAKDNVEQAYLPARNTDLTIDEASKWHIITQEPIYTLNKVVMLFELYINPQVNDFWVLDSGGHWTTKHLSDSSIGNSGFSLYCPIDITNYIVEKDVFDAMPLSQQKKHLYFKRGEKGIYGLYDRYKEGIGGLFTDTAIENIIQDLDLNDVVETYTNTYNVVDWSGYGSPDLLTGNLSGITGKLIGTYSDSYNPSVNIHVSTSGQKEVGAIKDLYNGTIQWNSNNIEFALFSINYQPYCDSVVKIEKTNASNIEANANNLSVLKNQSDRTIDATKYYDSQKALINRMGNKEMYLDCMIDISGTYNSLLTLWNLGDYFTLNSKKWTITQREIENYNMGKLKVRYTLSKEYNASNVDIQVNRDKRLYGIPLSQYVDRYIIIKNQNASYIDKLAIRSWDDFTGSITTSGFNILEMIKIGNSTITDRVARCMDNFAVDIERTKYSSTIVNVYTRYCDADGYKTTITLYGLTNTLYNSLACSDYSRLPFKPYGDGGTTIEASGYEMQLTNIYKDKMERLIFIIKN